MSGLRPWIVRGAGLAIGVTIVVAVLALAWAASTVLVGIGRRREMVMGGMRYGGFAQPTSKHRGSDDR